MLSNKFVQAVIWCMEVSSDLKGCGRRCLVPSRLALSGTRIFVGNLAFETISNTLGIPAHLMVLSKFRIQFESCICDHSLCLFVLLCSFECSNQSELRHQCVEMRHTHHVLKPGDDIAKDSSRFVCKCSRNGFVVCVCILLEKQAGKRILRLQCPPIYRPNCCNVACDNIFEEFPRSLVLRRLAPKHHQQFT